MYTVFIRNWYKYERDNRGRRIIVPNYHARKKVLTRVPSEYEARIICRVYNNNHDPGVLSRKAEYTS
jgi:hypothetical protein